MCRTYYRLEADGDVIMEYEDASTASMIDAMRTMKQDVEDAVSLTPNSALLDKSYTYRLVLVEETVTIEKDTRTILEEIRNNGDKRETKL